MKYSFVVVSCLAGLWVANAEEDGHCYSSVTNVCKTLSDKSKPFNCSAKYAGIGNAMDNLHTYAQTNIAQSFQYTLMSAYFGNYQVNRDGFSKLYRQLSDSAWENSIKLIKYMGHRGDKMNFDASIHENYKKLQLTGDEWKMHELSSLSMALEMEKALAKGAEDIHADASKHSKEYHDAETVNFLEKEFIHEHSENIRDLAGYANDVYRLIKGGGTDPSLSVFMFDEYLQKKLG